MGIKTMPCLQVSRKKKYRTKFMNIFKKKHKIHDQKKEKKERKTKGQKKQDKNAKPKLKRSQTCPIKESEPKMSNEDFLAFLKRLSYYNLTYMNFKMIVGIDENVVDEDINKVMHHVKKTIRFKIYNKEPMTANAIRESSKYAYDEMRIIQLEVVLEPIDGTAIL